MTSGLVDPRQIGSLASGETSVLTMQGT